MVFSFASGWGNDAGSIIAIREFPDGQAAPLDRHDHLFAVLERIRRISRYRRRDADVPRPRRTDRDVRPLSTFCHTLYFVQ